MNDRRHTLAMPDLDMPEVPIVVAQWLVARGESVRRGDRLIEILAGDVTVDLPAPVGGVLSRKHVAADASITVGQTLATIEPVGP